ncbi:glycosyltransferase family 2 protein [Candidatus Nitronereus thalassa]|uniref:Glycosyltransferase family 2 protein n=1 Tax=Candidatus Nitronereus thalassa TaxID=3020898 RepID=A0ABU3K9P3_9BACT|nr:glycosyltransferase family 2 protein [Candidatus Nitronereus thalassa]MDT7043082.1 glycosyltransferase family 2 protein [Candidatus Nitronereus thalassa]
MSSLLEIKKNLKVIAVLPAYNAEHTLEQTVKEIPRDWVDEILLVDDASQDKTWEVAQQLGVATVRHNENRGYGGNQKTCYAEALKRDADIVVMVHPDYQYDPALIPRLLEPLLRLECDAAFGSRMLGGQFIEGGMPLWKFYGNVMLTALENMVLHVFLSEFHSGFRAYSKRYLQSVNLHANSDDFVFDTEIIVQGIDLGLKIREVPITTRYFDSSSQISFWKSVRYALSIVGVLIRYLLHKRGLRPSRLFTASGSVAE